MVYLRKIVKLVLLSLLLLTVCFGLIFYIQPRIPLGSLNGIISASLSYITGMPQSVRGEIHLTPGPWIKLEARNVQLVCQNAAGLRSEISVGDATASLHILTLLAGQIWLQEVRVSSVLAEIFPGNQVHDGNPESSAEENTDWPLSKLKDTGQVVLSSVTLQLHNQGQEEKEIEILRGAGRVSQQEKSALDIDLKINGKSFRGRFSSSPLQQNNDVQPPRVFEASLSHLDSLVSVDGQVASVGGVHAAQGAFRVHGSNLDDLTSLVHYKSSTDIPFALQGTFEFGGTGGALKLTEFMPVARQLELAVGLDGYDLKSAGIDVRMRGDDLDLDNLETLLSSSKRDIGQSPQTEASGETASGWQGIPLPAHMPFRKLLMDVDVTNLVVAGKRLDQFLLDSQLLEDQIDNGLFSLKMGGHVLSGRYNMDLGKGVPSFSGALDLPLFDSALFLEEWNGGGSAVDLSIVDVSCKVEAQGRTLGALGKSLTVSADTGPGELRYHDPNTGAILPVGIKKLKMQITEGANLDAAFTGNIGITPLELGVKVTPKQETFAGLFAGAFVEGHAEAADTRWQFSGDIPKKFNLEGLVLNSRIAGKRLGDINQLLKVELPDFGPYELSGVLRIDEQGYQLGNLLFAVGESSMSGNARVDTRVSPPALFVELHSPLVQLDDFAELWQSADEPEESYGADRAEEKVARQDDRSGKGQKIIHVTDQQVLDSYDARINLHIAKVMSGTEVLGSALLDVEQSGGKFHLKPLRVDLPHGSVMLDFGVEPAGDNRHYQLKLLIEGLDYGVIGHLLKPGSHMKGILDLRVSLDSVAADYDSIMANSSGYLDFILEPEELQAGVVDLWAVNLLSYLIPFISSGDRSEVNCLAGRLNIDNGYMKEEGLLIDTSRIQVKGKTTIDFKEQEIKARLRPVPKRPQFYSLSTPIVIKGKFSDFKVRVPATGIIGTVIRLATSYIVVPLQWVIMNKVPEDGMEDCEEVMGTRDAG